VAPTPLYSEDQWLSTLHQGPIWVHRRISSETHLPQSIRQVSLVLHHQSRTSGLDGLVSCRWWRGHSGIADLSGAASLGLMVRASELLGLFLETVETILIRYETLPDVRYSSLVLWSRHALRKINYVRNPNPLHVLQLTSFISA
jgi:hypothetical protein